MEKERRTKALVVVVLLIVVAGLTVAFAALSATLNIKGTAYLDAAKWGIKFENLSEPESIGTATTTGTAKIEETKSAEINDINVSLSTPGDKVTYTVDLVNEGTINAKIDKIEKTVLTEEQQKYLTFKVAYTNGLEVSEGDILSKGETKNITITIEFIKNLTKEDLPTSTSTISLSYKLNFVQTDLDKGSESQGGNLPSSKCTSFNNKSTYNVGDVIALCNTNTGKSEDFYVIKDNGDTVEALAKYNLLVGNDLEIDGSNEWTITSSKSISTSTKEYGLQSKLAVATIDFDTYKGSARGVIDFVKLTRTSTVGHYDYNAYWIDKSTNKVLSKYGTDSDPYVYDSNSDLYKPLEEYASYLKNIGYSSVSAKLISISQLESLGAKRNDGYDVSSVPSFVFTSIYWMGNCSDNNIYSVFGDGNDVAISSFSMNYGNIMNGLRPVITIKKSEL